MLSATHIFSTALIALGVVGSTSAALALTGRWPRGGLVGLIIAGVALPLGVIGTALGLVTAFGAVDHVPADQKSQLLSEGINGAMTSTVVGLGVAAVCGVLGLFAQLRARKPNHR